MKFESEGDLQAHCLAILRSKKIAVEQEVVVGDLRADIVTEDAVFELKKVLTRESLYQALGQALTYNQVLKRKHICIVGQAPANPADFEQAMKVARTVSSEGVVVSFIEYDPFWCEQEPQAKSRWWWIKELLWMFGIAAAMFIVLCVIAAWISPQRSNSDPKSKCMSYERVSTR